MSRKYVTGDVLLCQGQSGKIFRLETWEMWHLLVFFLFFYPSLPKIWHSDSNNGYFLNKQYKGYHVIDFCFVSLKTVVLTGI